MQHLSWLKRQISDPKVLGFMPVLGITSLCSEKAILNANFLTGTFAVLYQKKNQTDLMLSISQKVGLTNIVSQSKGIIMGTTY